MRETRFPALAVFLVEMEPDNELARLQLDILKRERRARARRR